VIRRGTPADVPEIVAILIRAFRHAYPDIVDPQLLADLDPDELAADWRAAFARRDRTVLVAEVEGRVVAYASIRDDGDLRTLYVDPAAQGAGVGAHLLAEAERAGARTLEVFEANGHARAFYESRGWCDDGPGPDTLDRPTRRYVKPPPTAGSRP
jgi:ribosomal protein S18 acetylase RimI-like enzyme